MTNDRANRISERRGQSKKKAREPAEEAEKEDSGDDEDKSSGQTMKDERKEKMFYLSPEQHSQVDHVYNKLKTDFEYEYDQTFLKNKHYYTLVVKYGLDNLDDLDATEVHERLDDLGALDD